MGLPQGIQLKKPLLKAVLEPFFSGQKVNQIRNLWEDPGPGLRCPPEVAIFFTDLSKHMEGLLEDRKLNALRKVLEPSREDLATFLHHLLDTAFLELLFHFTEDLQYSQSVSCPTRSTKEWTKTRTLGLQLLIDVFRAFDLRPFHSNLQIAEGLGASRARAHRQSAVVSPKMLLEI